MKKQTLTFLLALGCLTFQACNSEKKTGDDSVKTAENMNEAKEDRGTGADDDDSEFAVKAANGGMLEIELGKLAQEKAQDPEVKAFGEMLVTDHSKASEELKSIATLKNISLPSTPGNDNQKHIEDLRKLSGAEFDKKFVSLMKDDHKEDVEEFKEASKEVKDPSLKEFADKTLPTLQMHLDKVMALDKKLN